MAHRKECLPIHSRANCCIFKSPNSLLLHYVYWNGPLILQQILLVWKDIIHKTDCWKCHAIQVRKGAVFLISLLFVGISSETFWFPGFPTVFWLWRTLHKILYGGPVISRIFHRMIVCGSYPANQMDQYLFANLSFPKWTQWFEIKEISEFSMCIFWSFLMDNSVFPLA